MNPSLWTAKRTLLTRVFLTRGNKVHKGATGHDATALTSGPSRTKVCQNQSFEEVISRHI